MRVCYPAGCCAPCRAGFDTERFANTKAIRQTEVWCSPSLCKELHQICMDTKKAQIVAFIWMGLSNASK